MPEGFVETPTRRRTTRKSVAAAADSSAEDDLDFEKIPREEGRAEEYNDIKVASNGASNGIPNGIPNGTPNGKPNGTANGAPKEAKIIDGWREG